jgi:alpha-tubulin suppressor-like RCC1 family protein
MFIWGSGISGQLGTGETNSKSTPVTTFLGVSNWKDISLGDTHTAAVKTDGTLWTWGENGSSGRLGIDATDAYKLTPVTTFAGGTDWKQVSCGYQYTAAIKTDGTLWLWGTNTSQELGIKDAAGVKLTPVTTFAGGTDWKQVSCGRNHTAAIKTDGTLWTWGENNFGQIGNNYFSSQDASTPVTTFAGGNNWRRVSCGNGFTTAIKTDGSLWTWGKNNLGQLGVNDAVNRSTPVTTFAGGINWKNLSCGGSHATATIYLSDY